MEIYLEMSEGRCWAGSSAVARDESTSALPSLCRVLTALSASWDGMGVEDLLRSVGLCVRDMSRWCVAWRRVCVLVFAVRRVNVQPLLETMEVGLMFIGR